ncbi:hypothetical protein MYMA111404_03380 [Mycoplasma marinum]|uniref:Uncharacterized protein n=1 Tax=Mycoplasma marinum TaxID=1937190 RepID=A0A4R0XK79_9MOLU|nr:hypothetical protein [Mycoplasma marinum]TCG11056.1 hypothetical protein C4B24_03160 [Mycoplasma marinum]
MNNKTNSNQLNGTAGTTSLIIGIFLLITLMTLLTLLIVWFFHSQIKRKNSKNYTGYEMSKYIFKKTNVQVEIKNTFFYVKFWNYNKRENVHKLRPWTSNKKSIWALMEASKQAYVTSAVINKSKDLWRLFWIPLIIKTIGYILFIVFLLVSKKDYSNANIKDNVNWVWIGTSVGVLFASHTIADIIRTTTIWKRVMILLIDSELDSKEIESIRLMFLVRTLFSLGAYFIDNNKLIVRIVFWIIDLLRSLFKP